MRYRTGLDDDVHAHVLATPGALELILRTTVHLRALADETAAGRLVRLTVACQGGHHRVMDRTVERHAGSERISACPRTCSGDHEVVSSSFS
ncbi:hypothetical protein [Streptomyces sp. NPDC086147]|uniref:hypothetical protein n=1 Tax=Streptomyces sp. NPDC086147 TaxID=3155295 RepID=UPI00344BAF7B